MTHLKVNLKGQVKREIKEIIDGDDLVSNWTVSELHGIINKEISCSVDTIRTAVSELVNEEFVIKLKEEKGRGFYYVKSIEEEKEEKEEKPVKKYGWRTKAIRKIFREAVKDLTVISRSALMAELEYDNERATHILFNKVAQADQMELLFCYDRTQRTYNF